MVTYQYIKNICSYLPQHFKSHHIHPLFGYYKYYSNSLLLIFFEYFHLFFYTNNATMNTHTCIPLCAESVFLKNETLEMELLNQRVSTKCSCNLSNNCQTVFQKAFTKLQLHFMAMIGPHSLASTGCLINQYYLTTWKKDYCNILICIY